MAGLSDAQVTVVGGGAIGAAAVYFLAKAGWTDIQLIEAGLPASETSSQAAGLLGQTRTTLERTRIAVQTAEILRGLAGETGFDPDWNETGSLRIATSPAAVEELKVIATVAAAAGVECEIVDAARVSELFPPLTVTDRILAALWVPTDGYVQPNSLVNAYLGAARALGARVVPHTRVLSILADERAGGAAEVRGLRTTGGDIACEMVVNAAGPWAGALARTVGVELPIVPVSHQYVVTEPVSGWRGDLPVLRFPEEAVYARGEGSSILCGGFERSGLSVDPLAVAVDGPLPSEPRWDVLADFVEDFDAYAPGVADTGIRAVFKGWPGFTPDGRFVVGPVSGVRGLVMAAGCNAHGVSGSAGIATHLVESLGKEVSPYVASLSPDRFLPRDWDWADARRDAQAVIENYYPLPGSAVAGGGVTH